VVEAEVSGDGTGLYNRTYTYDPVGNLMNKTGVGTYSYNGTVPVSGCTANTPSLKPHAVDNAGSWSFDYDCAGNMTTRNVGAGQYTLTYNEENKLAEVKLNGATQATYTYDGGGTLVKKVVGGETTVYVGNHFEKNLTTGEVTKYYTLGDRRVAMRKGSTLTYLHGDHLGSTSLATTAGGGVNDEMRYYPYGEARSGSMSTDRRFTGQREETANGLYDYKARYYDPVIGRFIQADTIVPEPGNPQALNRYAYVYGNPLRYTDPTGYYSEDEIMQSFGVETWNEVLAHFQEGGTLAGLWGWLEVLRQAQDGDFVSHEMKPKFAPPGPATGWAWGDPYNGGYFTRGAKGQILVDGVHHGNFATSSQDIYSLWRQDARESSIWGHQFSTYASSKHYHCHYDLNKVDGVDVALDGLGLAIDVITVGTGGRSLNGIQVIAKVAEPALDMYGVYGTADEIGQDGTYTMWERSKMGIAIMGVGLPYLDAVGLVVDFAEGVSITP
jgi:RHS repeat-associated protein